MMIRFGNRIINPTHFWQGFPYHQNQQPLTTLKSKPMKKDGISLFRMGYGFKISYVDGYGKEMCAPFIINSDNIIRQDPFFYSSKEGLNLEDYLRELEEEGE